MPGSKLKTPAAAVSLASIADRVPAMITVFNPATGEFVYVNDAVESILGYPKKEILSKGFGYLTSLIHPDDMPMILQQNQTAIDTANKRPAKKLEDEPVVTFIYRLRHAKGHWVWLRTDGSIFERDDNGKIKHILNFSLDITKRKDAETQLLALSEELEVRVQRRSERLEMALKASQMGMWEWNILTNELVWSDHLKLIYGLKVTDEITYERYLGLIHPSDRRSVRSIIKRAMKNGKEYKSEHRIIWPDGSIHWVLGQGQAIMQDGKPVRMIGTGMNIDERRELERQKDDFIGMASHELRTPVTSIKAHVQLMQRQFERAGDADKAGKLAKVNMQLDRLASLISDLLDATRVGAGKLQFHESTFDLDALVHEVVEALQPTSQQHKLIIKGATSHKIPGDKERVGQVVVNFITNAIKYSPRAKKIVITLSADDKCATVKVRDYGVGISKNEQKKVFGRFFRAGGTTMESFPGMGLGLYISSEIIKHLDGTIGVESTVGKGSTFYFTLPLAPSNEKD